MNSDSRSIVEADPTSPASGPRNPRGQVWGIVGYRHFADRARFDREMAILVEERGRPVRAVSGAAPGADTMAREWAAEHEIPFTEHRPREQTAAAFKARNSLIVRDITLLVAFVSTKSRGTHDTMNKASKAGKAIVAIHID